MGSSSSLITKDLVKVVFSKNSFSEKVKTNSNFKGSSGLGVNTTLVKCYKTSSSFSLISGAIISEFFMAFNQYSEIESVLA